MRSSASSGCIVTILIAAVLFYFFRGYVIFLLPLLGLLFFFPLLRRRSAFSHTHFNTTQPEAADAYPLLVLFAAIMKADGHVMRTELVYVSDALKKLYPPQAIPALIDELRNILHQNPSIEEACEQILAQYSLQSRISILYMLVGLAKVDGVVDPQERYLLYQIAARFYINSTYVDAFLRGNASYSYSSSYGSNGRGYTPPNSTQSQIDPYQILGITPSASDAQVKSAYRKLVNKWHPDRFQNTSQAEIDKATEKFKEIQSAYETICNARGLK